MRYQLEESIIVVVDISESLSAVYVGVRNKNCLLGAEKNMLLTLNAQPMHDFTTCMSFSMILSGAIDRTDRPCLKGCMCKRNTIKTVRNEAKPQSNI